MSSGKTTAKSKSVTYTEYDIDDDEAARDAMVARGTNGQRTVPQIFINDQHIGGNDDLYHLEKSDKLDELLGLNEVRS